MSDAGESSRSWVERVESALVADISARLVQRNGSVFRAIGEAETRQVAARLVTALGQDLAGAEQAALRELLARLTQELLPRGMGYADLRQLAIAARQVVLAALDGAPEPGAELRRRADAWLFQLGLLGAMRYVTHRERQFQEQSAELEVAQLEGQLIELKLAFEEKARLLDQIRQASTPIAPIHDGILVVPLVGVFDDVRAQVLSETLLAGISRMRAQVVILDISGVPIFDAEAAAHIVRAANAVRLLGAELILVGISAAIAATIIATGVDLAGLTTLGTLQAGLTRALALRDLKIVAAPATARGR